MKLSRRGWNNVLMIGCLVFIAAIQLPELIKNRLAEQQQGEATDLLPFAATIERIEMPEMVLYQSEQGWQADRTITVPLDELVARWATLAGTEVTNDVVMQLRSQMTAPMTVEVWIAEREEPLRITAYSLPNFWLMQNWESQWIAITVDGLYLFPYL